MSRLTIYGLLYTIFGLSGRHTGLARSVGSTGVQARVVFKLRVIFRYCKENKHQFRVSNYRQTS
jgi:hypothetical protein